MRHRSAAMSQCLRRVSGGAAGVSLAAMLFVGGGCSDAQSGALLGAGVGALAGQAIGGNTKATLIGTAIGTAVGYGIGNESDKERIQQRRYRNYEY